MWYKDTPTHVYSQCTGPKLIFDIRQLLWWILFSCLSVLWIKWKSTEKKRNLVIHFQVWSKYLKNFFFCQNKQQSLFIYLFILYTILYFILYIFIQCRNAAFPNIKWIFKISFKLSYFFPSFTHSHGKHVFPLLF